MMDGAFFSPATIGGMAASSEFQLMFIRSVMSESSMW
jgi:hypothetical protein